MYRFKTREEALVAANAEGEELMKNDNYVEFEGMNCNDYLDDFSIECEGWDGASRRCDCGHRRVSWELLGSDASGWDYFACAY